MSRRSNGGGCGCLLVFLWFGLPLLALPFLLLVAPGLTTYLMWAAPSQMGPHLTNWAPFLLGAPALAAFLVWLVSPASGQLRGRLAPPDERLARPRAVRLRGILGAFAIRMAALLGATNGVALWILLHYRYARFMANSGGVDVPGPYFMLFLFAPMLAGAAVLAALRVADRRPWVEPVTVETVRAVAAEAEDTLRRVRAENARVRQQADRLESELARVHSSGDFQLLRGRHGESVGCADGAHGHYQSAQTSLHTMHRVVSCVRGSGSRWRGAREELQEAAAGLERTRSSLAGEVERGLAEVRRLNANTARLKHTIRDTCGPTGQRWFEALEARIAAARTG